MGLLDLAELINRKSPFLTFLNPVLQAFKLLASNAALSLTYFLIVYGWLCKFGMTDSVFSLTLILSYILGAVGLLSSQMLLGAHCRYIFGYSTSIGESGSSIHGSNMFLLIKTENFSPSL
jgi:hypothetical protein